MKNITADTICEEHEGQTFDRKSARISPQALAATIVSFANADGGIIVVGVEDDGTVSGIDRYKDNINELIRVPYDFCVPSVNVEIEYLSKVVVGGKTENMMVMKIPQSSQLHATNKDEVYLRLGDKSKKLTFEERLQLLYAKGARFFEDEPVPGTDRTDIDINIVENYCRKIGYSKSVNEYLRQNKNWLVRKMVNRT